MEKERLRPTRRPGKAITRHTVVYESREEYRPIPGGLVGYPRAY